MVRVEMYKRSIQKTRKDVTIQLHSIVGRPGRIFRGLFFEHNAEIWQKNRFWMGTR